MEEDYTVHIEKTKEKEDELETYVPQVKAITDEYEENTEKYETLKYHVSAQNREHESLKYGICLMKQKESNYKNEREKVKNLLKKGRNEEMLRMKKHLNFMYVSEKDIYETEQKLRLLILENDRIRKALKLVREDIQHLQKEGQNSIDSVDKMNLELDELQGTYVKMWEETLNAIKKFRGDNKITVEGTVKLMTQLYKREEKLKIICGWLRRHIDNLYYIIDYKESNTVIGENAKAQKKKSTYKTGKKVL
uniref:Coiled-coil domain-containing protein 175 n=1 Tax=Phascolarctos cinereus TaxID=38626 RepID=A0A6P5KB59_PHACI|nr:coiled-coil domain-containing protein 175 [Phascolarctos cinereus]